MSIDFEKFDNMIDGDALQKEIEAAASTTYDDVPAGEYVARIEKMEVKPTKKNDGLNFSVQMKIIETVDAPNKQDGRWIFFNRKICGNKPNAKGTWNDGVAIKGVMNWLESLESDYEITFTSYSQFASLVLDIFQSVHDSLEFAVAYMPDEFTCIVVKEVYDA